MLIGASFRAEGAEAARAPANPFFTPARTPQRSGSTGCGCPSTRRSTRPGVDPHAWAPASIAFSASVWLKWMSAMTGIGESRTMLRAPRRPCRADRDAHDVRAGRGHRLDLRPSSPRGSRSRSSSSSARRPARRRRSSRRRRLSGALRPRLSLDGAPQYAAPVGAPDVYETARGPLPRLAEPFAKRARAPVTRAFSSWWARRRRCGSSTSAAAASACAAWRRSSTSPASTCSRAPDTRVRWSRRRRRGAAFADGEFDLAYCTASSSTSRRRGGGVCGRAAPRRARLVRADAGALFPGRAALAAARRALAGARTSAPLLAPWRAGLLGGHPAAAPRRIRAPVRGGRARADRTAHEELGQRRLPSRSDG